MYIQSTELEAQMLMYIEPLLWGPFRTDRRDFVLPQRTEQREVQPTNLYPWRDSRVPAMTSRGRTGPVGLKVVASEGGGGLSKMLGSGPSTVYKGEKRSWHENLLSALDSILPN